MGEAWGASGSGGGMGSVSTIMKSASGENWMTATRRWTILRKGFSSKAWPCLRFASGANGGEGVANAQQEVSVAHVPEVAGAIVEAPLGAGENFAGGDFEQDASTTRSSSSGGSSGRRFIRRWTV